MAVRHYPRKLLVEGETDKRVIPYLMEENGVEWPDPPPVFIKPYHGVDELLKPEVIPTELKASGLKALGVVVDANGDAAARWDHLRTRCGSDVAELPHQIPAEGLRVDCSSGPRFGVWIMPDNRLVGMLEDLLAQLIPAEAEPLYDLARQCVAESKRKGAPFKDIHKTKAEVYTWLAWQDAPGLRLHEAVKHRVLDPARPESQPFVTWFRGLFGV